jgi:Ca2+-binding EF-hand superfamily protein
MFVLYIMSNGSPEANLKQIFRVFDINGDGSISQKEMVRIVKDLFHLLNTGGNPDMATGEQLATTAFKEMDVNLDGQVCPRRG